MDFKTVYVASNCNQTPTAADCNSDDLIAYASSHAVLIYDPHSGSGGRVTHTLIGHTKRVNSVRWIRGAVYQLVSGATDGSLVLWAPQDTTYVPTFLKPSGTASVNIVDGWSLNGKTVICCAPSLMIWTRPNGGPHADFQFGPQSLCVGLRLGQFPGAASPLVACALDNSEIVLLAQDEQDQWTKCCSLTGHEDWVRGLDFREVDEGDLLLASGSQDCSIRIWRLSLIGPGKVKAELESVLAGHEGWIYSVNWSPAALQLLSASIDKSLIIWAFDNASGLWLEKARLGGVGGNTLGFYGGFFGAQAHRVVAHSYHGAFHIWARDEKGLWSPAPTVAGHFGEVVDVAWEPQGEFVYSASVDQTARIYAPWSPDKPGQASWHEIARPQVHGYDLSSLAVIGRFRYASGAEEKIVRIFEAPATFVDNLQRLCKVVGAVSSEGPKGASVPSLGLSNKAVFSDDNVEDAVPLGNKNPYPEESHFTAQLLMAPPTEETLLQNTLWPEVQKLYGHGYEVFALAASPDGRLLASSCKASKAQHAAIFLWDTSNWQLRQQLAAHMLTVVQMQFSPNSLYLLSVSRDRRWSLFAAKEAEDRFALVAASDNVTAVHKRIIWTCAWTHDSKYFATGSRDGKLVMWTENGKKATDVLDFPKQSVTAVAFGPGLVNGGFLCAVGLEFGIIELFGVKNLHFEPLLQLPKSVAHHLTVRKLAFRPKFGRAGCPKDDKQVVQLCSASSDASVRIYELVFGNSVIN